MRIFLAAPFGCLVDQDGKFDALSETRVRQLVSTLRGLGHTVFSAHEREEFGKKLLSPEEATRLDYEEMVATDLVIAVPGNPASGGVHVELGWASILKKRVILLLGSDMRYSFLITGLKSVANVTEIHYGRWEEALSALNTGLIASGDPSMLFGKSGL